MKSKRGIRQFGRRAAALMIACVMAVGVMAAASEIDENRDKLENVQENINRIERERREAEQRLANLRGQQASAEEYIAAIDREIASVMAEIAVVTENKFAVMQAIAATEEKLLATQARIAETEERLAQAEQTAADQYERMKLRIRYMYERSDTEYLEMLMSASSLIDFLNRTEYISQISEYDRDMLDVYEATIEEVNAAKELLLERRSELEAEKTELEEEKAALAGQEAILAEQQTSLTLLAEEKGRELDSLQQQIGQTGQQIIDYDEALKEEEAEFLAIQKEIERLEEEERRRQEALNSTSSQTPSDMGMIWPVASCTRITSYFGYREDPLTGEANGTLSDHKGIDIALPGGALAGAPVSAAASGQVLIARLSASAGNWIVLYHGNSTYTVYMHLSSLNVSAGDTVSQGQTIGLVGSTGWSTAAHLHFEVRIGGFVNSTYSVNPLGYVSP